MTKSIFDIKLDEMLNLEKGPKILLLDEETSKIISNLISYSTFIAHDFFFFDLISKTRERLSQTTCFVIIKPYNVSHLKSELSSPKYDNYIILFTTKAPEQVIIELAKSDITSSVRGVYDLYIDVSMQDYNLYTTNIKLHGKSDIKEIGRTCDSLFSIFQTLNYSPDVYVQGDSEIAKILGIEMCIRFRENPMPEGAKLMILDRKSDLISTLVYSWTYQAMLDEYFEYENGLVKFDKKTYCLNSDLFQDIKFLDINSAISVIKEYINLNNSKISDGIIKSIEERARKSEIGESLLVLYNKMVSDCLAVKELSGMEFEILRNNKIKIDQIKKIVNNKAVTLEKRLKLLIIWLLRNKFDWNTLDKSVDLRNIVGHFCELKEYLIRFRNVFMKDNLKTNFIFGFRDECNIKLGFEPYIKRVVSDVFNERLNLKRFPCLKKNSNGCNELIIFVAGGLTYNEYRVVSEYIKSKNAGSDWMKVTLVSNEMINYKNVLNKIL